MKYIYKYKRIRSTRIQIVDHQTVKITAHPLTPKHKLQEFIEKTRPWVQKNLQKFSPKPTLNLDSELDILGEKYQVKSITYNIEKLQYKLKQKAKILISDELEKLCLEFNFSYNNLSLRNQKTRFGSCSSKNNLSFNWQCIFFPYKIFRHLLLHELVHTKIKNHQEIFWSLLTKCDPDTKNNNAWLKKNGARRYLF